MSNPTAKSSSTVLLSTIVNVCLSNAYMKSIENDWNQQCILPLTVVGKSSLTSLSRNLSKWKFDHSIELHHTVLLCYSKGRLFLSSPWNDRYSLSGFLLFLTKKKTPSHDATGECPFFSQLLELWPRIHPKWARLCETILGDSLGLGYFLGDSYHLPEQRLTNGHPARPLHRSKLVVRIALLWHHRVDGVLRLGSQ